MLLALALTVVLTPLSIDRELIGFDEPGFPRVDAFPLSKLPDRALIADSGAKLEELLVDHPAAILVWRHPYVFPAEAWDTILAFLDQGGDLLCLAGEPFTIPVAGVPGERVLSRRTVSPLRELGLLHPRTEHAAVFTLEYRSPREPALVIRPGEFGDFVAVLEPRFASTKDFPDEEGSPGTRDATLRPLAGLWNRSHVDVALPTYAAAYAIDRLRGRFAGGRWVFRLLTAPASEPEVALLLREASREPAELTATPTFACYHEGERPRLRLRALAPASGESREWRVSLALRSPGSTADSAPVARIETTLQFTRTGEALVELPSCDAPGLWRVSIECEAIDRFETGFEVMDEALFASGGALRFDGDTLVRDGRPLPLFGTTAMSPDVFRAFLFEPNPAAWDHTFAELTQAKMNCVRTGLWYGWKKASSDPGAIDEGFLRALEAYALAARRHGVVLIFTFFTFLPEDWGGTHAYLDPRAVDAQRAFVSAIARRLAPCRELMFDLINEPSFAPPSLLWRCRPSGSAVEEAAFSNWLGREYAALASGRSIDDAIRERWNLAPNEPIGLPTLGDFEDPQVFAARRPERARDFLRFAQDAFTAWALDLRGAIRDAGSNALVTVGQDEGGLLERPHPLLHASAVDFTSLHTWWWNDALYFDSFTAKAHGKPLLVSETGVQPRELHDGTSERGGHEAALLLSRKIATAYAARAFGVIQWCWHTNPYMDSDAESLIGLVRVDGSETWELRVMRAFAAFVARHRDRFAFVEKPDIAFVLPQTDLTGPRAMPKEGVARAMEILAGRLNRSIQVIPEWAPDALAEFDTIVVPASRGLRAPLFAQIDAALDRGARVVMSGSPFADAVLRDHPRTLGITTPLARFEPITIGGEDFTLEFPLWAYESGHGSGAMDDAVHSRGAGRLHACRLPIEWNTDAIALEAFYRHALGENEPSLVPKTPRGVFATTLALKDGFLVTLVNESGRGVALPFPTALDGQGETYLGAGEGKLVLLDSAGRRIDETRW